MRSSIAHSDVNSNPAASSTTAPSDESQTDVLTGTTALTVAAPESVNLGQVPQGTEKSFELSLIPSTPMGIKEVIITPATAGVAFSGGTFPGTGGDCAAANTAPCKLDLIYKSRSQRSDFSDSVNLRIYASDSSIVSKDVTVQSQIRFLFHQDDFTSTRLRLDSLTGPQEAWSDGTKLIVLSTADHRILGWNTIPTSSDSKPDFVLGSEDKGVFGHTTAHQRSCTTPTGVTSDGQKIIVSCFTHSRVLIWNSWPTQSFAPADVVIGQPDFISSGSNTGGISDRSLASPRGVLLNSGRLYIADQLNHRVLIFNTVPTANYQSADRVLGQPNFVTGTAATSAVKFNSPIGVAVANDRLYVSEYGNSRVVSFPSAYPANGATADIVLGQTSFATNLMNKGATASASTMCRPYALAANSDSLYVADSCNHRVLRYGPLSAIATNQDAVQVYGQPDFVTATGDGGTPSATSLDTPIGLEITNDRLFILDLANNRMKVHLTAGTGNNEAPQLIYGHKLPSLKKNPELLESATFCEHSMVARSQKYFAQSCFYGHRILIWDQAPANPNEAAPYVLGQQDFVSILPNEGGAVSAKSINRAYGMSFSGNSLWVGDSVNNRVLKFDFTSPQSYAAAAIVIGQSDFVSNAVNQGLASPTAATLRGPGQLFAVNGKLIVADGSNHRVLIYNQEPTTNGALADLVLGQSDFTGSLPNRGAPDPSADTLSGPGTIWSDGTKLAIVDGSNHRVLLWNTFPTSSGQPADVVIGQTSFAGKLAYQGGTTPTQGTFNGPGSLSFALNKLYVSDRISNRIQAWDGWPTATGQLPTSVLFQESFTTLSVHNKADRVSDVINFNVFGNEMIVTDRQTLRLLGLILPASN